MKKVLVSLVVLILLLLSCTNVMAVKFDDIKMNVNIPEEYYDLKSAVDSNDAKLTYYTTVMKTTTEELKKQFENSGIIYDGVSTNLSKELIISTAKNNSTQRDFNLNLVSDDKLNNIKEELKKVATDKGLTVESQEVYQSGNIKFINSTFKSNTTTTYQYYTVVNGNGITIALNTTYSNVNNDVIKKVVNTVSFDEILEKTMDSSIIYIIVAAVAAVLIIIIVIYLIKSNKKNKQ